MIVFREMMSKFSLSFVERVPRRILLIVPLLLILPFNSISQSRQELEKQDALLEAMKKRQILEKLKDQGIDRYNQMMLKKEMDFIDEIAVNQFVRKTINVNGDCE